MQFLVRLIEYTALGIALFAIVLTAILLTTLVVNRGLQLFFRLLGYEMGDFFGWIMRRIGFKKIKKEDIDGKNT